MDRQNFYHGQDPVDETDLQRIEAAAERSINQVVTDFLEHGIVSGLEVGANDPPDWSVLVAPGVARDVDGNRIPLAEQASINCQGEAPGAGMERWLTLMARFARYEYDQRQDYEGNSLLYRRDEAMEVAVRYGAEAPIGQAERPAMNPNEVILADIRRYDGQVCISTDDIDNNRRKSVADVEMHRHDGRYYTKQEVDAHIHDERYYTQAEVDNLVAALDDILQGRRFQVSAKVPFEGLGQGETIICYGIMVIIPAGKQVVLKRIRYRQPYIPGEDLRIEVRVDGSMVNPWLSSASVSEFITENEEIPNYTLFPSNIEEQSRVLRFGVKHVSGDGYSISSSITFWADISIE